MERFVNCRFAHAYAVIGQHFAGGVVEPLRKALAGRVERKNGDFHTTWEGVASAGELDAFGSRHGGLFVTQVAALKQGLAHRRQIAFDLFVGRVAHRQRVVQKRVTWPQEFRTQIGEVDHKTVAVEFARLQRDLELPRMPMQINARAEVPANVVRERNINAARNPIAHAALMALCAQGATSRRF